MNIGIFDSGVGGLSVARNYLLGPRVNVFYVADTANMPYGTKSSEHIQQITFTVINFLLTHNVDLIIIACHTASILVGDILKKKYTTVPFILMQDGIIEQALAATKNDSIGIIGTCATIKSNFYRKTFLNRNDKIRILEQACPTLASSIEQYFDKPEILRYVIDNYLYRIIATNIDTLVLACTHYSLIEDCIKAYAPDVTLISSDKILAHQNLAARFVHQNVHNKHKFFVSGNKDSFEKKLDFFLNLWDMKNICYTVDSTDWKIIQYSKNVSTVISNIK